MPPAEPCRFLSANYAHTGNVTKRASDGYESIPTVVSMADVYIDSNGFVWNDRVRLSTGATWRLVSKRAPASQAWRHPCPFVSAHSTFSRSDYILYCSEISVKCYTEGGLRRIPLPARLRFCMAVGVVLVHQKYVLKCKGLGMVGIKPIRFEGI